MVGSYLDPMVEIQVLYRDNGLLIVDKPAGILVVPAPGRRGETLADVLSHQVGSQVMPVHRLDEDTTGAIVFALDDAVRVQLEQMFREHSIEREYLALLAAAPSPPAGRIESSLAEGADGIVRVVTRGGQRAVTHYRTLDRRGRCCLVTCRLETGRRNQIRVHMAAMGCPIAGDRKYGFRSRAGETFVRPMLHSWRLDFVHPTSRARVVVEVPAPEPELQP